MFDDHCPFTTAALEALLDALLRFEMRQTELESQASPQTVGSGAGGAEQPVGRAQVNCLIKDSMPAEIPVIIQ